MEMTDTLSSLIYFLVIIFLVLIGAAFFGAGNISNAKATIKSNLKWIFLLLLGFIVNSVASRIIVINADYTPIASQIFGDLPSQIQASVQFPLLTGGLSLLYLLSLPVILILTPILFAEAGDAKSLRQFCLTIAIAYIGVALLHLFAPVTRPALYPGSGVAPFLYNYPVLGNLTNLLGSRSHSFPSAHTTLIFATFLLLIVEKRYRGYSILIGVIFLFIPFTVMYLGIHWPIDVIGGMALGFLSVGIVSLVWRSPVSYDV